MAVVPAKAGTHTPCRCDGARPSISLVRRWLWVPACAGTTVERLCVHNELPHPRRGEWQLARLDTQGLERGGDRIRECAPDRDDAALARALGAERIVRRRMQLERDRGDIGIVGRDRNEIVGERSDQRLPA